MFQTEASSIDEVRRVIEDHQVFYEVTPYYVLFEERPAEGHPTSRGMQAGFDVDVFGIAQGPASERSPKYALVYQALSRSVDAIRPDTSDGSTIEVIPLESTVIFDLRSHFQEEATLRIRIAHSRGLDQPVGPAEERALQKLQEELKSLGIKTRRGR